MTGANNGSDLRRWLAIGSGIGIEIGARDLRVAAVRVRPSGAKLLGTLTIPNFRSRPAGEWGAIYGDFARKLGMGHMAAAVLLPREAVIVRQLSLPGVANRDLANAITFQMDTLHPYPEDEVMSGWARLRGSSTVLVAITRKDILQHYTGLFAEAGVKVFSFTCSAAVLYSSLRLLSSPPADGFLACQQRGDAEAESDLEVYGESPARPVFSATFDEPCERACALALAELRLQADQPAVPLSRVLPPPVTAPPDADLSRTALSYATALAGACPRLALPLNLLPVEQRAATSRGLYIPSIALAALLLLMAGAVWGYAKIENVRYLKNLQGEIARLDPQAKRAQAIDRDIRTALGRTQLLDNVRRHSKQDMDALQELTRVLPAPTWVNLLDLTRNSATLTGETDAALPLLKTIDASPLFEKSEFIGTPGKNGAVEIFRIRALREGVGQ